MTLKKRGLGRGLEILLADTATQENLQYPPVIIDNSGDEQTKLLIEHLHQEKQSLLQEAEALRHLINEFELMIRAELQ